MSKILFLAWQFPPEATTGAARAWKLALYMQAVGWETFVVASPDIAGEGLEMVPEGSVMPIVYRTAPVIEPGLPHRKAGAFFPRGLFSGKHRPTHAKPQAGDSAAVPPPPPELVAWRNNALQLVGRIMEEHPDIEVVYAQGPPAEPLFLAIELANKYRLAATLDILEPFEPVESLESPLFQFKKERERMADVQVGVEERILASGMMLLVPTRDLKEYFIRKYPGRITNTDITIVPPGYNSLAPGFRFINQHICLVMRWAFLIERLGPGDIDTFARALEAFAVAGGLTPRNSAFLFLGESSRELSRYLEGSRVSKMIVLEESFDSGRFFGMCAHADLFCSVLGGGQENRFYVPDRMVDALGMYCPQMVVAPAGVAGQLARDAGGMVVSISDEREIKKMFLAAFARWKCGSLSPVPEAIHHKYRIEQSVQELTMAIAGRPYF